jgi:hypothetical protein
VDLGIAVDQGPALSQSLVLDKDRMSHNPLIIKDEVIVVIELDCRWKSVLETM